MTHTTRRQPIPTHAARLARGLGVLILAAGGLICGGCGGGSRVTFHYPGESIVYPPLAEEPPALFVEYVNDLRPATQREGQGGMVTARFPSDENWDQPASQIYYQALVQDLAQTNLVEVVPLRSQADYVLEVDLNHMGCKVSRNAAGFLVTGLAGGALGYAVGGSGAAAGVGAIVGMAAIPVPTNLRAVCQVRLRIYEPDREPFFEQECLGEISKNVWDGLTTRRDQQWVDEYLSVAVKRCNACLLGQLRQAMTEAHEAKAAGAGS